MNKPLDHETIAKAMKKAAWVAKHGTREERSGRFIQAHDPESRHSNTAGRKGDR